MSTPNSSAFVLTTPRNSPANSACSILRRSSGR